MADERLLAPIRRFWTPSQCSAAYEQIFAAYHGRLAEVTVIIGKQTAEDGATAQVVVRDEDYLRWMEALEIRLQELEAADAGQGEKLVGTEHVNFGARFARS